MSKDKRKQVHWEQPHTFDETTMVEHALPPEEHRLRDKEVSPQPHLVPLPHTFDEITMVKDALPLEEHRLQDKEIFDSYQDLPSPNLSIDEYFVLNCFMATITVALGRNKNAAQMSDWLANVNRQKEFLEFLKMKDGMGFKYRELMKHCYEQRTFRPIRNLSILRNDGNASTMHTFHFDGQILRSVSCNDTDLMDRVYTAIEYGYHVSIDYFDFLVKHLPHLPDVLSVDDHKALDTMFFSDMGYLDTNELSPLVTCRLLQATVVRAWIYHGEDAKIALWPLDCYMESEYQKLTNSTYGRAYHWLIRLCFQKRTMHPIRNLAILRTDGYAHSDKTFIVEYGGPGWGPVTESVEAERKMSREKLARCAKYYRSLLEKQEEKEIPQLDTPISVQH